MNIQQMRDKLKQHNQEHLLRFWDQLEPGQQKALHTQITGIDFSMIGRLEQDNAPKGDIAPIPTMRLQEIAEQKDKFEAAGLEALRAGKVGAVLLAGGQGTRLGFHGPKGSLNIGETRELYLFEQLIRNTMAVTEKTGAWIPFYIMTSGRNNVDTVAFFNEHQYFGYNKEYIRFFTQDMAPSVDLNGKILLDEADKISLSPNGNGGWFSSMIRAGLLDDIHARGVEWLNVFSVDNPLQRIADPVFVGATILSGCHAGAKGVRKKDSYERVGVMCLEGGRPSIFEYYELTDEFRFAKDGEGRYLYDFGVILNYLFEVEKLTEIAHQPLPLHMAEKKIPHIGADRQKVEPTEPNGYKFETLILDLIRNMETCLPFEVEREKEFAPIKNKTGTDSLETARALMKRNGIEL